MITLIGAGNAQDGASISRMATTEAVVDPNAKPKVGTVAKVSAGTAIKTALTGDSVPATNDNYYLFGAIAVIVLIAVGAYYYTTKK